MNAEHNTMTTLPWGPWDPPGFQPMARSNETAIATAEPAQTKVRLPKPVFVGTEPWREPRVGAAVIACSDGRYGDAVDEFCHNALRIPAYDRFTVPGGPGWISDRDPQREELCRTIRDQLGFLVDAHKLSRIVLITHYGCGFYGHRLGAGPQETLATQLEDVRHAQTILRQWFGPIRTAGYLALPQKGVMTFRKVE